MKNSKRLLGLLLIILAIALVFLQVSRTKLSARQGTGTTANLLAVELRKTLRSPVDSLMVQLDQLLSTKPDEMKIFELLKSAKDVGRVYGAFVESSTRTLMDPYDKETIPEGPMGSGMLTLSTGNLALPVQDELDAISAFEQEKLRQDRPMSTLLRYLNGEKESPLLWLVRPFITPEDTTVKELGVGFMPLSQVDPFVAHLLNEAFPQNRIWLSSTAPGAHQFALELITPGGEVAYALGDKTGKILAKTLVLDRTDLAYTGWTIRSWMPKPPSGVVFFSLAVVMGILGLVLLKKAKLAG